MTPIINSLNSKRYFYYTLIISIIVQIVTGIIEFGTSLISIPDPYLIIKQLLILEVAVQSVEGAFYAWLAYNFNVVSNVTPSRYIDWCITTPTMLITLVIYLIYLGYRENEEDTKKLDLFDLIRTHSTTIIYILGLNWLMLLFGYLGEAKIINTYTGVFLGFIPFIMFFYIIYTNFTILTKTGWILFWYFFIFWSFYGIVAVLPYYLKNTLYNILDLFAKNFFGIFLSYIILAKNY